MAKHRTIKRPPLLWRTVSAAEIVAQLGISYSTLKRWRYQGLILEGFHWNYLPNTKARISYNLELLRDYMANGNGEAHDRSIERYVASLASSA